MMDDLYKEYGKLLFQFKILQGKINECEREMVQELNNPQVVKNNTVKKDDKEQNV